MIVIGVAIDVVVVVVVAAIVAVAVIDVVISPKTLTLTPISYYIMCGKSIVIDKSSNPNPKRQVVYWSS